MTSRYIPEDMLELAKRYRDRPYAPYSRFRVVSVVRGGSGRLYVGVNVENASYGLTVCAERVAIFNAVTQGERRIREVLVYALDSYEPIFPCGACRQVIAEFSPDGSTIIYAYSAKSGKWRSALLRDLLPETFKLETSE